MTLETLTWASWLSIAYAALVLTNGIVAHELTHGLQALTWAAGFDTAGVALPRRGSGRGAPARRARRASHTPASASSTGDSGRHGHWSATRSATRSVTRLERARRPTDEAGMRGVTLRAIQRERHEKGWQDGATSGAIRVAITKAWMHERSLGESGTAR